MTSKVSYLGVFSYIWYMLWNLIKHIVCQFNALQNEQIKEKQCGVAQS